MSSHVIHKDSFLGETLSTLRAAESTAERFWKIDQFFIFTNIAI